MTSIDTDLAALLLSTHQQLAAQQEQIALLTRAVTITPSTPPNPITVRELVDKAESVVISSSRRTWLSGWKVLRDGIPERGVAGLADRMAHEVQASDLTALVPHIRERAKASNAARDTARFHADRAQRNGNGEGAVYSAVGAWRHLFTLAEGDGNILRGSNPAKAVHKPRRLQARRTWLDEEQLRQVVRLAGSTGDDPELDQLLTTFHLVTGARQEGALNLRVRHLDLAGGYVVLDEKNNTVERQPVPDWLLAELFDFARSRGATGADDVVFRKRTRSGTFRPIGRRRYNYLFERLQSLVEWVDVEQVTAHTLRHSAGHLVERLAGKAVATAFLRHAVLDVTGVYTRASRAEVAAAVIALWGGHHPSVPDAE